MRVQRSAGMKKGSQEVRPLTSQPSYVTVDGLQQSRDVSFDLH